MASSTRGAALRQLGQLFEGGTVAGLNDRQLLERFLDRRDEIAFAAIVERHGPMVLGVCRAVLKNTAEVEDAFQATFLVLVRKAGSVRGVDTLGGWLHRVAYRIAVQAAADIARRRALEQRSGELAAMKTEIAGFPDDLRALLHEEIDRLPENLRLAIVLCDLDGLRQPDAARQLGWTDGALRGRLSRARAKLRDRLTRRGLVVTAAILSEALARESTAAVPRAWVNAIARAAVAMPAGKVVATGAISATAAKLARTTLATLFAESARGVATVGVLLVALGLVGSHAIPTGFAQSGDDGAMKREMPGPRPASAPSLKPIATKADEDRTKPVTFAGVVLDPDGKPFEGAKISLVSYGLKDPTDRSTRAASGVDGRFKFDVPIDQFDANFEPGTAWQYATLVARAEGFAFGMASLGRKVETPTIAEGQEPTIRLARDDVPIEGRVIDLQGKPVPGVSVAVRHVHANEVGDLGGWLRAVEEEGAFYPRSLERKNAQLGLKSFLQADREQGLAIPTARTDLDGRFRIVGIGRERLAELHIEGPTIETVHVYARTRPGETLRVLTYRNSDPGDGVTIYGSSFTHVAGPTQVIEGGVHDRDTGKPLAGITIQSEESLDGNTAECVEAISDARGHYRLVGLPSGQEGAILALAPCDLLARRPEKLALRYPPDETLPYLQARVKIPRQPGSEPIKLDIGLKRGVWVTGRVLNKVTRAPVRARVEYFVFFDNPALKRITGGRFPRRNYGPPTGPDGSFHLVAFPGPGILTARAHEDQFVFGVGYEGIKHKDKDGNLVCEPFLPERSNYHALVEIEPDDTARTFSRDLVVDPGRILTLNVIDAAGKPIAADNVAGLKDMAYWEEQPANQTSFRIEGIKPGKRRTITARNDKKKLAGQLVLNGDEQSPVTMTLGPWGEITGRLVDPENQPYASPVYLSLNGSILETPRPDKDGRFRIDGLIPGRAYSFSLIDEQKSLFLGQLIHDVVVKPGEVKDVGDMTPKAERPN